MALSITVDKRLDVAVGSDTYPTVILGLIAGDSSNPEDVYELVQTSALTEVGIAVRPYGLVVCPNKASSTSITFVCKNAVTHETTTMTATMQSQIVIGGSISPAA